MWPETAIQCTAVQNKYRRDMRGKINPKVLRNAVLLTCVNYSFGEGMHLA